MTDETSPLTVEAVIRRVQAIADLRGDPEESHSEEDGLYADVLKAIAGGASDAPALAREALKTQDLDFPRWYA